MVITCGKGEKGKHLFIRTSSLLCAKMFQVLLYVFLLNPHCDPETDLVLSYFTCKEAKTQESYESRSGRARIESWFDFKIFACGLSSLRCIAVPSGF